jgi:hypothetical protein
MVDIMQKRSKSGAALSVVMMFLAIGIILPLIMFCFELNRYYFARQQLKSCVDLCALAGAATNASSNNLDHTATQQAAIATALQMFRQNAIFGYSLSGATQASSLPLSPAAGKSVLYFTFLDPVTRAAVPLGSPNGEIMQVTGAFGWTPVFGTFIGLKGGVYPISETSLGGLPQLDVVLCFDVSASMDDFTLISAVNRFLPAKPQPQVNGYTAFAKGPLYTAFQATQPTGTAVNATFPQELDASGGTQGTYIFDKTARGINNGHPAPAASATSLTDLVVNIDGNSTFGGFTSTYGGSSYSFPTLGSLIEASRGNLETKAIADAAAVPYATWGVTAKSGYYSAYNAAALAQRHPMSDAIVAATNFFTIMNNDCDAHFGLVTFSTQPGANSTSTAPPDYATLGNITDNPGIYMSNASPADPYSPLPPNPTIPLNPSAGSANSNFSQVSAAVLPLVAYGGTDIAGALNAALKQVETTAQGGQGLGRTGATKAIVLFTDGLPTVSSLGGDPATDARTVATQANAAGIPIYCIGLCLVPSLQASQTAILTDTNSNPSSGGIAGISSHGAGFYQANNISELNRVFENVARALVQLVH